MIWSPVGDLKWAHFKLKTFYELFQNTFWWRGEVTLHRRFNIYSTGATSKTTKCLLIQMCQKKANRCLVMHFCPTWFWTCPGTSSLQAAPNCWAGDRCFYCGGAVADWADWKANVNGFAESSRHSAHTNSIRGHKPGIRVSAQLISIWAIITLFTFLFSRRNKNVQEVHKQEKLYLVWP